VIFPFLLHSIDVSVLSPLPSPIIFVLRWRRKLNSQKNLTFEKEAIMNQLVPDERPDYLSETQHELFREFRKTHTRGKRLPKEWSQDLRLLYNRYKNRQRSRELVTRKRTADPQYDENQRKRFTAYDEKNREKRRLAAAEYRKGNGGNYQASQHKYGKSILVHGPKNKSLTEEEKKNRHAASERKRRAAFIEQGVDYNEKRKNSFYYVWEKVRSAAKAKKLALEVSAFEVVCMAETPCTYCGVDPAKGIDRRDNSLGYTKDNVQAVCTACNYAKRDMSETHFISANLVIGHHQMDKNWVHDHGVTWVSKRKQGFLSWLTEIGKRGKESTLSEEEFLLLKQGNCTYCGISSCNGIDRINDSGMYSAENAQSCCWMCNQMKYKSTHLEFMNRVFEIFCRFPTDRQDIVPMGSSGSRLMGKKYK
jgi:hypothetical protein